MTGIAGVKIKIMPKSPSSNIDKIAKSAVEIIEKENGKRVNYEINPIAFGIKALIVFFQWPEEKGLDKVETKLKKISEVQSVEMVDIRKIA